MLARVKMLEENISHLEMLREKLSLEEVKTDKTKEWALRYGFLETIQIIVDISCHLCSKYNLGNPATYSECIKLLQEFKYLNDELTKALIGMTGLRNLLIHEYASVDVERLYSLLDNLQDVKTFLLSVKDYV